MDPAWNPAITRFNASQAHYDGVKAYNTRVKNRTSRYKEFMRKYVHETKDAHLRAFKVDATHTWADVQTHIDRATQEYDLQGSSWRFPFRKFGRTFSENASAMQAAIRMKEVRDKVFKCLARIPEVVEYTKGYLRLYRDDADLHQIAQDLYVAILEAVEDMTAWFNEKAYTDDIDSLADAFSKRTDFCFQSNVKSQNELQNDCLQSIKVQVTDQYQDLKHELDQLKQKQQNPDQIQIMQPIFVQVVTKPSPIIRTSDIISLCGFDLSAILHDINTASLSGHNLKLSQQSRSAAVIKDSRFQHWLKMKTSAVLHVDGSERGSSAAISPISYACNLLWQALESLEGTDVFMPLIFFCGLHTADGDPLSGAVGIVKSLVAQLLLKHGANLDLAFVTHDLLRGIETGSLDAFCYLFRGLLCSLSHGTVFCIVDGISWVENDQHVLGLRQLLAFLMGLVEEVRRTGGELLVKVLLTSPSLSECAGDWLGEDDRITLPSHVPSTGHRFEQAHMAEGALDSAAMAP
ncbi:hypothetical protein SLS54_008271 [Diplodia seriata]